MTEEKTVAPEAVTRRTIECVHGTVFTQEELQSAYQDMREYFTQFSSIAKSGLTVGSTRPKGDGYFAVFDANEFFVASLNFAWGNTWDGRVDAISTPLWLLDLAGTELETEAKELSLRLARSHEPDNYAEKEVQKAIGDLHVRAKKLRKTA